MFFLRPAASRHKNIITYNGILLQLPTSTPVVSLSLPLSLSLSTRSTSQSPYQHPNSKVHKPIVQSVYRAIQSQNPQSLAPREKAIVRHPRAHYSSPPTAQRPVSSRYAGDKRLSSPTSTPQRPRRTAAPQQRQSPTPTRYPCA